MTRTTALIPWLSMTRVADMPREIEGYRENLALISEAFPGKKMLSVDEVADYLGCNRKTITRLIENGKLVAIDVGTGKNSHYRVPVRELARLSAR